MLIKSVKDAGSCEIGLRIYYLLQYFEQIVEWRDAMVLFESDQIDFLQLKLEGTF